MNIEAETARAGLKEIFRKKAVQKILRVALVRRIGYIDCSLSNVRKLTKCNYCELALPHLPNIPV